MATAAGQGRAGDATKKPRIMLAAAFEGPALLWVAGAAIVSAVVTALFAALPSLQFAYRQHELHTALTTAASLIGGFAAYLVLGRFRRSRQLDDFVLAYALALFALTNLLFSTLLTIVAEGESTRLTTWAALFGRVLATAAFAGAAFAPQRKLHLGRAGGVAAAISLPILFAATAIAVAALGSRLPIGVMTVFPPEESGRPHLEENVVVLGAQLVAMVLFALATIGFVRKAGRGNDVLMAWLAVGAVFGAFDRLNYFLYPSLYTEWVYVGDLFRSASYLAFLAGAAHEISTYWRNLSRTAVLEERRRLAREVHDGIAQELAFIGRNLHRLDPSDQIVSRLKASAARAITESRHTIETLTGPLDQPLEIRLARAAEQTADREGTRIELDLVKDVEVDAGRREAVIRITCEAIANAARHGRASLVRVELSNGDGLALSIVDDGVGFDPRKAPRGNEGFGLVSMRERAEELGGSFNVRSEPGAGTRIEVVL